MDAIGGRSQDFRRFQDGHVVPFFAQMHGCIKRSFRSTDDHYIFRKDIFLPEYFGKQNDVFALDAGNLWNDRHAANRTITAS
jgi:hypothetical protein